MTTRTLLLSFTLLFTLSIRSQAQLSWSTRQLDFHPTINEPSVTGEFEFFNPGTAPVTITEVKTSCGCTTAALEKKVYAPGEKGKISAKFTIGERMGLQQKQIMVSTDNPAESLVQLTMRTFIPELVRIEPHAAIWPLTSPNGPRTIKLIVGIDQPIRVLGVRSSDDRVFAQLKQVEPGRSYEIELSVASTQEPLRAVVRIETDYPPDKPKVYNIQAEVSAPFAPRTVAGMATPSSPTVSPGAPQTGAFPGTVSGTRPTVTRPFPPTIPPATAPVASPEVPAPANARPFPTAPNPIRATATPYPAPQPLQRSQPAQRQSTQPGMQRTASRSTVRPIQPYIFPPAAPAPAGAPVPAAPPAAAEPAPAK